MGEISVSLKYGSTSDVITIPSSCTLQQLLEIVEERTGVLTRKQKLICRGKILTALPASTSLTAAGIRPGDKLMLLAGAAESQGRAALRSSLKAKASALRERQTDRRAEDSAVAGPEAIEPRTAVWRTTGVASLRDLKLVTVPPQLYEAGESIRVADLGGNQLTSLPAGGLARLSCLQKLRLSLNRLEDGGMPWVALTELTSLIVLALDSNRLTSLHPSIGRLTRLQKLSVANNAVTDVPESIGNLTALRALCIRGNRIAPLPPSLGQCTMLEELDASNNPIEAIPEQLSSLKNLKVLLLDNTRVRKVPSIMLTGCVSLATLALHGCPITTEELRETPGFAQFDARRRQKYDKQVDMRVLLGKDGFDEGADAPEWEHWKDM